ncbi:hypothetical protein [Kribbella speibonae]|uniref:hypothetical protein n=1 Tax=Kribbella speibonae TaxID=1572660 RepID=UPI00192D3B5E|nr:hypothetical protein [Kribbella speibonae]
MKRRWIVGTAGVVGALVLAGWPLGAQAATGPQGQEVTASQSSGLNPAGTAVTVRGSGFDLNKGIYVVFCVNKGAGQMPTPCLGGVDMKGDSGSSAWISSNPPSYGEGLAKPFTEVNGKGSFEVRLQVKSKDQFTNCLDKKVAPLGCVIGTRADHTRTADRSADVLIPVTFAGSSSTPSATPSSSAPTSSRPSSPVASSSSSAPSTEGAPEKKSGSLASTGGVAFGILGAAVGLLGGGAALVIAGRRRQATKKEMQA